MPYQNLTPMKRIIIIAALALVACQQKPLSDLSLIKMGSPISNYKLDANDFSDKGMQPIRYEVPLFHMIEEMPDENQWRPLMHTFEGETYNYTYGGYTVDEDPNDPNYAKCIIVLSDYFLWRTPEASYTWDINHQETLLNTLTITAK